MSFIFFLLLSIEFLAETNQLYQDHKTVPSASNSFSDPASGALSAVISKMIKNKGFPFNVFEILYDSGVNSVFHQYSGSDQIHTKAIRSYLGVGRSANLRAIRYEMALLEPRSRTQIKMLRFYFRLLNMENCRLTKQIYLYHQHFSTPKFQHGQMKLQI